MNELELAPTSDAVSTVANEARPKDKSARFSLPLNNIQGPEEEVNRITDTLNRLHGENEKLRNENKELKEELPEKPKNLLQGILNNFMVKHTIPEAGNVMQVFGNAAATIANMMSFPEPVKKFANVLGAIGTKTFLITNGVINTLENLERKNIIGFIGYLIDIVVGIFVPQKHTYLDRGSASGTYTFANTLNKINSVGGVVKNRFETVDEYWGHVKEALKKSYKNFFGGNFWSNLADSDKGMFGIACGVLNNLGVLLWLLTGNVKLGTTIRDFGGILLDAEQAHIGNLRSGKPFYFASGWGLVGGTITDFLSKWMPQHQNVFVPLSLMLDAIGRYILRMSQNRGEV